MNRKVSYFLSLALIALAAFLLVAFWTAAPSDWPFSKDRSIADVANLSGPFGSLLAHVCFSLVGRLTAWFFPLVLVVMGLAVAVGSVREVMAPLIKVSAIVVLVNALFALIPFTQSSTAVVGAVGTGIAGMLDSVLGRIGATILLITCLLLVFIRETRYFIGLVTRVAGHLPGVASVARATGRAVLRGTASLARALGSTVRQATAAAARRVRSAQQTEVEPPPAPDAKKRHPTRTPPEAPWFAETADPQQKSATRAEPAEPPAVRVAPAPSRRAARAPIAASGDHRTPIEEAVLPPLSILRSGDGQGGAHGESLKNWSDVLEDKLAIYGVEGKVTAVNQGPLVTTFEFAPAPGVKIKDIVSRADDLALAMRARSLRLIAPIPGREVVGIEIPNPNPEVVFLYDVLSEIPERLRVSGVMIALGVDTVGKPFHINLCAAPHLLMAGTTGSGKSVSLNTFLASMLFQYRPSDLQLLLVDPKMVEMSVYNGIPHLLHPVITDPKEAVRVFNFLIGEMERRNELFRENGVRNIESYNSKIALGKTAPEGPTEKLPYVVLVVDELADLVLQKGADIETLLSRLANMARAVGIHMILATQRPSVDVIVGKTKANFPTRIAFRVASKVDSRTILDLTGAEKLLGRGDMLYVDARHPEGLRIHGCWLSEDELEALVAHWKQYVYDETRLEFDEAVSGGIAESDRDPMFDDARDVIMQYRQGSTSLLQRKLHVGYARAARLLDQLEMAGIVGPPDGSKPREVLVSEEEVGRALDDSM